jgi:hypothetical protein
MFSSARYKTDYHLLTDAQLIAYHTKLVGMFKEGGYGPFQALRLLIGEEKARVIGNESCDIPPFQHPIIPGMAHGKSTSKFTDRRQKKRKLDEMEYIELSSD